MKNELEYIFFYLFAKVFQLLGLKVSRRLASLVALIFYYLVPIRKSTVVDNLKIAFPELSEEKIKKISFNVYKGFSIFFIEILIFPKLKDKVIERELEFSDPDLITSKFNEDKGLIILSAHFGNWELIPPTIGVRLKLKGLTIVKPLRNHYVDKWMNNLRTRFGNEIIPLGISLRKTYQALKEKKMIGIAADQRGPEEGVKVRFFNTKVPVYSGPSVLSIKTGSPILSLLAVRQKDNKYKIIVKEIDKTNLPENFDDAVIELTQRHTMHLENMIKKYPEQWFWMHKKWKHLQLEK
ncbi:MAG: lysophospholipid acyltransferase family protein [Ignavibacteriaceae bacterium]|nr:lysophospholipid acyltransferase family protein [Ignavibacteria bacterium]NNJ52606.1 lysophospholipid acyltransferase family protein [Ignavibacteriaceae bacterium]